MKNLVDLISCLVLLGNYISCPIGKTITTTKKRYCYSFPKTAMRSNGNEKSDVCIRVETYPTYLHKWWRPSKILLTHVHFVDTQRLASVSPLIFGGGGSLFCPVQFLLWKHLWKSWYLNKNLVRIPIKSPEVSKPTLEAKKISSGATLISRFLESLER